MISRTTRKFSRLFSPAGDKERSPRASGPHRISCSLTRCRIDPLWRAEPLRCENGCRMSIQLKGRALPTFQKRLLAWFERNRRDLPWRSSLDPYRVWVAEIMLQQTRIAAVMPYYDRFLSRFPDVQSLASARQEEVLSMWSGLGYYSRARNL